MSDLVLIDFHHERIPMWKVPRMARAYGKIMPDHEIFFDGDRFAIVARRKVSA